MKAKGIHREQHIVENELEIEAVQGDYMSPNTQVTQDDQSLSTQEHNIQTSQQCTPPSNQCTFVPRRRLPDDLQPVSVEIPKTTPTTPPVVSTSFDALPGLLATCTIAAPVDLDELLSLPPSPPAYLDHLYDTGAQNQIINNLYSQQVLTDMDFDYSLTGGDIVEPPAFLGRINLPLHPGTGKFRRRSMFV